jgi:hypothetical protein
MGVPSLNNHLNLGHKHYNKRHVTHTKLRRAASRRLITKNSLTSASVVAYR